MEKVYEKKIWKRKGSDTALFEEAVKNFLAGDLNSKEIVYKLIKSFVNEPDYSGDYVGVGHLKLSSTREQGEYVPMECGAVTDYSSVFAPAVYYRKRLFKLKNLCKDLAVLFHELEHAKTYFANKNKSIFKGEKVLNYVGSLDLYQKRFAYLLSGNEHNSRMAEIKYLVKFIKTAEKLMLENENLNTSKNKKIIKKLTIETALRNKKHENQYNRAIKQKEKKKNQEHMEKYARKAFEEVQNSWELGFTLNDQYRMLDNYIVPYLEIYKDESFAREILDYAVQTKGSFFKEHALEIINTGAIPYSKDTIDEIITRYYQLVNWKTDVLDWAKHHMLFYGEIGVDYTQVNDAVKEFEKSIEKFKFNGIPIYRDKDFMYKVKINGKVLSFCSQKEAELEVLKYVNSTIFDNLNAKEIKRINSIFGSEVIKRVKDLHNEQDIKIEKTKQKQKINENTFEKTEALEIKV